MDKRKSCPQNSTQKNRAKKMRKIELASGFGQMLDYIMPQEKMCSENAILSSMQL